MVQKTFDNDLVAMNKNKVTLKINKPGYAGMRIFYLSKVLMYEFHYDFIKIKHGNNWKLSLTDTENLIHDVKIEDVYESSSKDREIFDFSISLLSTNIMIIKKIRVGSMKDGTSRWCYYSRIS